MEDYRITFCNWTLEKIKNLDMFKQSVNLTFRGKTHFSNTLGALSTLVACLTLLGYGIVLFRIMFKRTNVSWNHNSVYTNLAEDHSGTIWGEDDPEFKVFWSALDTNSLPEGYEMEQLGISNFYSFSSDNKNNVSCANSFYTVHDKMYPNGEVTPSCPQLAGQTLQGRFGSGQNYRDLTFKFEPCMEYEDHPCVPQNEMAPILKRSTVMIHLMNRYVDLNDIDNPIKKFYDDEIFLNFKQNKNLKVELKMRQHEVILEDGLFPTFSDPDPIYFNSIEDYSLTEEEVEDPGYFWGTISVRIRKDSQIDQHRRKVLNFLEVTGILGGFFEVFEIGIGVIIGLYSSHMFKKSLHDDIRKYEEKFKEMDSCITKLESKIQKSNQRQQENNLSRAAPPAKLRKKSQLNVSNINYEPDNEDEELKILEEVKQRVNNEESKDFNMEPDVVEERKIEYTRTKFPTFGLPTFGLLSQQGEDEENDEGYKSSRCCPKFMGASKTDMEVERMKESLGCLNIIYMIKVLRRQMQYLLLRDPDYQTHLESNPGLHFDHASQPSYKFPQPDSVVALARARPERVLPYCDIS
ncbi:unnamed protein product [Moneuplotes crassus]|uniref:Uncharacterized protein n=1 Tax=Euplotes crassus TaxID=5936 RepID=A0AAD1U6P1_EUPCR|nr:unnamed protein product [Moneuplotes crassus]